MAYNPLTQGPSEIEKNIGLLESEELSRQRLKKLDIPIEPGKTAIDTEKEYLKLLNRIERTYTEAGNQVAQKARYFLEDFRAQDEEMRKQLEAGELTEEKYQQWRMTEIAQSDRWDRMRQDAAEIVTKANEVAAGWINESAERVFTLNYNALGRAAQDALTSAGITGVSFDMVDEHTVKNLLTNKYRVHMYRKAGVDWVRDTKWNKSALQKELIAGIVQGESIEKVATRFQSVAKMGRKTAVMNARTNITSAEGSGKQARYENLEDMGVIMEKEWTANKDGRERPWHNAADKQRVGVNDPFIVNGEELMFPADPAGSPNNICNCRCGTKAKIIGFRSNLTEEQRKKAGIKVKG